MTEFSKTSPVFYKWPDLSDVQGIVTSTVALKSVGSRVSLLTDLHACRISECTVFAVANNVKNSETRGTVFLKYNEKDYFYNICMTNDTYLVLVKVQPIKGTVHLV